MTKVLEGTDKEGRGLRLCKERDGRYLVWVLRRETRPSSYVFEALSYHRRAHRDYPHHEAVARDAFAEKLG